MTQLSQSGVIAPSIGEYWIAAGIHFTSFKLLDSFALLTVKSPKATHRSARTIEIEAAAMTQAIALMENLQESPYCGRARLEDYSPFSTTSS